MSDKPVLLIASAFSEALVEQARIALPEWTIRYHAGLVPTPAYDGDHTGTPPALTTEQVGQWQHWLAEATAMVDFDWWAPEQMAANCRSLRWVQGTSSGVGGRLAATGLDLSQVAVTTASGVHGQPLAEFVLGAVLHHYREFSRLEREMAARHWARHAVRTVAGRSAVVLGRGALGQGVATLLAAVGVEVTMLGRDDVRGLAEGGRSGFGQALASYDIVVLCMPSTPATRDLFDADVLGELGAGCLLINIGRGDVLDEDALVALLESGRLGGAVLDVTREEPLPSSSSLWSAPRLLLSQHSAANSSGENDRIMSLTIDNARRFLRGEELVNRFDPARGY